MGRGFRPCRSSASGFCQQVPRPIGYTVRGNQIVDAVNAEDVDRYSMRAAAITAVRDQGGATPKTMSTGLAIRLMKNGGSRYLRTLTPVQSGTQPVVIPSSMDGAAASPRSRYSGPPPGVR
jgi:hypothetical protein